MRGIYTPVTDIRRKVFTEVARMAYEVDEMADLDYLMRELPYEIIPRRGTFAAQQHLLWREPSSRSASAWPWALSLRPIDESVPASEGLQESVIADKYYEPPLINVIKFACNRCPEKVVKVTDMCQGCLAHPCQEVCPKKAISFVNGRSHIDQGLCVKCGRCVSACPLRRDHQGRAPLRQGLRHGRHPFRQVRPCRDRLRQVCVLRHVPGQLPLRRHCGQGPAVPADQVHQARRQGHCHRCPRLCQPVPRPDAVQAAHRHEAAGFAGVAEVAIGADLCTIDEAKDFMAEVPEKHPFMGTSCCPAWSVMAKKLFPQYADCISMTMTPMVLTARLLKAQRAGRPHLLCGPLRRQKAGSQPPQRPQRGGLCADL